MLNAAPPILQFGTSRFLQAHADLFISEALQAGRAWRLQLAAQADQQSVIGKFETGFNHILGTSRGGQRADAQRVLLAVQVTSIFSVRPS